MRRMPWVLAVIFSVLLFAGCESGNTSAPISSARTEKKPVEITVVTSYGGDDGNRQNYEKALRAYEASSGNSVKDSSGISNEEWKASVMASFDSGTEPDILFYFTGADANRLIQGGKVISIEEIRSVYPDYASNMKDDIMPKSPVDGKNYAVPVNGYWEGLFVNKKVLSECGVEIPGRDTTWDEFMAMCETIYQNGYIPIAASLNEVPHYWFEFCVFNNGSLESHALIPESSGDDIGKIWAAGLDDINTLYKSLYFPDNTTTATGAETDALIIADKAAFMIDGSWKLGWFAENAADINNFTVTYVPGKGERKPTDVIGGLSMGYFISKKAWDDPEKQEACVNFVQAMTSDEVVATFGATAVTALKDGTEPPKDANSLVKDALNMINNISGIVTATEDGLLPNARGDLFGNVKNIVSGSMTAQEAIDHCLTILD